jgi:thiol peroxidase
MNSTNANITLKGNPVAVHGTCLAVGQPLPLVTLTGTDLKDVSLEQYLGKKLVVLSVPSLDTPVCQTEAKRFNEEATSLGADVQIVVVSRDLPFAQKRWCGAEGVERVLPLSDYKLRTFGEAFGVDIPAVGILCRAVFVADSSGMLTHVEYVSEVAEEPDYGAALAALA